MKDEDIEVLNINEDNINTKKKEIIILIKIHIIFFVRQI